MNQTLNAVLVGAVAMASFVVSMFFLRFWHQTRDRFFLLFSIAFAVDAISRFVLGLVQPTSEEEPIFYLARLLTFSLIIAAIVDKNRPRRS